MFDALKMGAGAFAGIALAVVWMWLIHDPAVRAETRTIVQAENAKLTQEAINEVSGQADKARAMRKYCGSVGKLYDFAAVGCID